MNKKVTPKPPRVQFVTRPIFRSRWCKTPLLRARRVCLYAVMTLPPEIIALIQQLRGEIAVLQQENADLRRRLGLDSSTSSKPPSSDGLGKKARIKTSLRGRSGKRSGGQVGHRGDTLRQVSEPDKVERHEATACADCQNALTPSMETGVERRQVFDLVAPRLEVVEHQGVIYRCACCRATTRAAFPAAVTGYVQYGKLIQATALYLNAQQLVPEDRVSDIMRDLFGAGGLCPASIVGWGVKKAVELAPVEAHIATLIARASVRHLDETGMRVTGQTHWLHVASTSWLTHYRVSAKRGAVPRMLTGGIVVHDHFKPYFTLKEIGHALCNAHHLRELKAVVEYDREPWANKMARLLVGAANFVRHAVANGQKSVAEGLTQRINTLYDQIIRRGIAAHEGQAPLARKPGARGKTAKRTGHNLLVRLRDFKAETLRFLVDFDVPFTNNLAEQAVRMPKVKQKVSDCFRTSQGAQNYCAIRSYCATMHKQGANIFESLVAAFKGAPPQPSFS